MSSLCAAQRPIGTQTQDLLILLSVNERRRRRVCVPTRVGSAHKREETVRSGECNRREALVQLSDLVYPIAGDDADVLDATVREAVVRELNPVLEQAGYTAMVPWEF